MRCVRKEVDFILCMFLSLMSMGMIVAGVLTLGPSTSDLIAFLVMVFSSLPCILG